LSLILPFCLLHPFA